MHAQVALKATIDKLIHNLLIHRDKLGRFRYVIGVNY